MRHFLERIGQRSGSVFRALRPDLVKEDEEARIGRRKEAEERMQVTVRIIPSIDRICNLRRTRLRRDAIMRHLNRALGKCLVDNVDEHFRYGIGSGFLQDTHAGDRRNLLRHADGVVNLFHEFRGNEQAAVGNGRESARRRERGHGDALAERSSVVLELTIDEKVRNISLLVVRQINAGRRAESVGLEVFRLGRRPHRGRDKRRTDIQRLAQDLLHRDHPAGLEVEVADAAGIDDDTAGIVVGFVRRNRARVDTGGHRQRLHDRSHFIEILDHRIGENADVADAGGVVRIKIGQMAHCIDVAGVRINDDAADLRRVPGILRLRQRLLKKILHRRIDRGDNVAFERLIVDDGGFDVCKKFREKIHVGCARVAGQSRVVVALEAVASGDDRRRLAAALAGEADELRRHRAARIVPPIVAVYGNAGDVERPDELAVRRVDFIQHLDVHLRLFRHVIHKNGLVDGKFRRRGRIGQNRADLIVRRRRIGREDLRIHRQGEALLHRRHADLGAVALLEENISPVEDHRVRLHVLAVGLLAVDAAVDDLELVELANENKRKEDDARKQKTYADDGFRIHYWRGDEPAREVSP